MRLSRIVLLLFLLLLLTAAILIDRTERSDPEALHPDFRDDVLAVLDQLTDEGHSPRISASWRAPVRQEVIFHLSQLTERLGMGPGTTLRGGDSCHNQERDDVPASAAADIRGRPRLTVAEQADFYKALGRAAKARGLRWGGDWKRKNPTWAAHGLGWDPGHIDNSRLCNRLRGR